MASTAARQAIEVAEENLLWLESYESDIVEWLAEEVATPVDSGSTSFSVSIIFITVSIAVLTFN